jgi:hypothetical protein
MARIVNTSDKPYEFCFDACVYGPYAPGQVIELPNEIAAHGVRRSQILDEIGNTVGFKCEFLNDLKNDKERMENLLVYDCPLKMSDQCNVGSFKSLDDLRSHLETHWAVLQPTQTDDDLFASVATSSTKSKR